MITKLNFKILLKVNKCSKSKDRNRSKPENTITKKNKRKEII